MIAIPRHENANLLARLDHTRTLRKLMPDPIDLDVEQRSIRISHNWKKHQSITNQESRKAGNSFRKIDRGICARALTAEALNRKRSRREVKKQAVFEICSFEVAATNREMNVLELADSF